MNDERRTRVEEIQNRWLAYSAGLRSLIEEKTAEVKKLRADADDIEHWMQLEIQSAGDTWGTEISKVHIPVEDGHVVGFTKKLTPDELQMHIDKDEMIYVHRAPDNRVTACWLGPWDPETKRRRCYICGEERLIGPEAVDVATVPRDLPAHIAVMVDGEPAASDPS